MKNVSDLFSAVLVVVIVCFLIKMATRNANPGLPKFGSGKKAKGGGDAVANWVERLLTSIVKGIWNAAWNLALSPFRRRPPPRRRP